MKNTKGIGERTEGIILAHLLKMNRIVLLPFGNNQPYDLVVDEDGQFIRIQCKTARFVNGCVVADISRRNTINGKRKSYFGLADVIMLYCEATDKIYQISVRPKMKKQISLRVDKPKKHSPKSTLRMAKDYEI